MVTFFSSETQYTVPYLLLIGIHDLIYLAVHGPCWIASRQIRNVVWPTSPQVWSGYITPLHLQSLTDREPHHRPVSSDVT